MAKEELNLTTGNAEIPRINMGEVGTVGLNISDKQVLEQVKKELRFPRVIETYKTMINDPIISAGLRLIEMMICRVSWEVSPPKNPTEDQIKKAKFIEQCMGDMEHSWDSFIKEVLSYIGYGYCVNEKVFRRRRKNTGSKYEDNLVGWKKLPVRSQDTIYKWEWSKDGRELKAVYQDLSLILNSADRFQYYFKNKKDIEGLKIPINKVLLFRYDTKRNNPMGNSPLNNCFLPFKFRSIVEEQESIGLTRDLTGLPVIGLPAKYMSPDATPEDKAIYDYYKRAVTNISNNEQAGLVYPLIYNDAGKKLIDFELMGTTGGKMYDTNKIVKRWDDKILTALFADILKLGQDSHGSFSLAGAKTDIVSMNIESRLKEIADVLNQDLIKQTFKLNGWDDTELPKFTYGDIDQEDFDAFSKLIQRIASVGFLPRDKKLVHEILERGNFKEAERFLELPDEEFEKLFPNSDSRAGDGMKTAGDGTSNGPSKGDNSVSNTENS